MNTAHIPQPKPHTAANPIAPSSTQPLLGRLQRTVAFSLVLCLLLSVAVLGFTLAYAPVSTLHNPSLPITTKSPHAMTKEPPNSDAYPNEAPYVIAALFLMFAFILCWPWTAKLIDRLKGPPQSESLGVVQSIHFVGGIGMTTQIETDTHTFLVNGAWSLPRGTRLQRRESITAHLVCIVDTEVCERLLSRLAPAPDPNLRPPS